MEPVESKAVTAFDSVIFLLRRSDILASQE